MSELDTLFEPMVDAARRASAPGFDTIAGRVRARRRRRRRLVAGVSLGLAGLLVVALVLRRDPADEIVVVGETSVSLPVGVTLSGLPPDLGSDAREVELAPTGLESEIRYGYDDRIFRIGAEGSDRSVQVVRTRGRNVDIEQEAALDPTWSPGPLIGGRPSLTKASALLVNGPRDIVVTVSASGLEADEFDRVIAGFSYDLAGDVDVGRAIPGAPIVLLASDEPGRSWSIVQTTTDDGRCVSVNVGLRGIACLRGDQPQEIELGRGRTLLVFSTSEPVEVGGSAVESAAAAALGDGRTINAVVTGDRGELTVTPAAADRTGVTCPDRAERWACLAASGLL